MGKLAGKDRVCAMVGALVGLLAIAPPAVAATLHDQFATTGPERVSSQNFEPSLDEYDSLGVDDFVVPGGKVWRLDRIEINGDKQGTTPITSTNVYLFGDGGTLPGPEILSRLNAASGPAQSQPDLDVPLTQMPVLSAGRYWIGVQANLIFSPGSNNWFWRDRAPQFGLPAAWRQPGDGFADGCTAFVIRVSCPSYPASGDVPDQAFKLSGSEAGSRLSVLKAKPKRRGKLMITINSPALGELVVRSKALKTARVELGEIGSVRLTMKPKPATRNALEDGALKTKLKLVLDPSAGATLRAKKKARLKP